MEELVKILKEIKPEVNFEEEDNLIENEILDSLDIVTLVSAINREFDIQIPINEIIPENFNSAQAIYKLIEKIEEE